MTTITDRIFVGSLDVSRAQELRDFAARIAASGQADGGGGQMGASAKSDTSYERPNGSVLQSDVTIDCAAVERVDAAAAQIFLALARSLERRGQRLVLRALPERPASLLRATGFGALLGETHDAKDARGAHRKDGTQQEVTRG